MATTQQHLRLRGAVDRRQAGAPRRRSGQGAADRQHREPCGFTPQFAGPRGALARTTATRAWSSRLSEQPVRRPGPGQQRRDRAFCQLNYGVSFPMMEQGRGQRRRRAPALEVADGGSAGPARHAQAIKWNFTKFLVGRDGQVIKRYAPNDTPESMRARHRGGARRLTARSSAMFEHVEPFAGDPILSLNEDFQKRSAAGQDQPVDRHLLRRRRAASRCSTRCAAPRQQVCAARRRRSPICRSRARPTSAPRCRRCCSAPSHEALRARARRDDPVGRLERRPEGRRRLHRPLASRQRGLGQRPELGEPPLDVRGRRPRGAHLSVLRRRDRRARASTRCCAALRELPRAAASSCCTPAATTRPAST